VTPVTTPEQANARMAQINADLPPNDGVRVFNAVYLLSRQNVLLAADTGYFADRGYIRKLDVHFVRRWLMAYDASVAGQTLPHCWRPVFDERNNPRILPIQFVIAGLIAHIFRDLTLAVFETESWWNVIPNKLFLSAHWRDYHKVNSILIRTMNEEVLPNLRDEYDSEIIEAINFLVEPFLASTGAVSITGARTDAWDRGNTMRLTHPLLGDFGGTAQDTIYSIEAAALARVFLAPILVPLP
jgi:hypothetical protein